jgi:hypothetical protein
MNLKQKILSYLCGLLFPIQAVWSATYYVSPQGNDRNDGSIYRPWQTATIAFANVVPGDTVYFRQGVYRVTQQLGTYLRYKPDKSKRIYFKGYPGERAVITTMALKDSVKYWTRVPGTKIYWTPIRYTAINSYVPNCSQDGIPLRLMTKPKPAKNEDPRTADGTPQNLTGPGQWVRNLAEKRAYVWSTDGANPGTHRTEICNVSIGECTLRFYDDDRTRRWHHNITLENLILEGGYHTVQVQSDNVEIKNCVIRNAFACALKISPLADHGMIERCDLSNYGETGIANSGGSYWTIRRNRVHDSRLIWSSEPGNCRVKGITVKYDGHDCIIEQNVIYNVHARWGVISLGEKHSLSAVNVLVRNNLILNCSGQGAVCFWGTSHCSFLNNVVCNSRFSQAIVLMEAGSTKATTIDRNVVHPAVKNNIFLNNVCANGFTLREKNTHVQNIKFDYNRVDPQKKYFWRGKSIPLQQFQSAGYDVHSLTADPKFADVNKNDFRLQPDSPCINAGDPNDISLVGETDIYLQPRIKGGRIDIGIHEAR